METYSIDKVIPPAFKLATFHQPKCPPRYEIQDGVRKYDIQWSYKGGPLVISNGYDEKEIKAHLAHLLHEHRNGRVAQATCQHGPCDWRRMTDPRTISDEHLFRLVLCEHRTAEINRIRSASPCGATVSLG